MGGIVLSIVFILLIVLLVKVNSTDGAKFKREYERYNNKKDDAFRLQRLKINKKNKVEYLELDESIEILKSGTGFIYFGAPTSPWARGAIPVLLETVNNSSLSKLYYVDMTDQMNEYEVQDNQAVESTKAPDEYYELLNILKEYLDDYTLIDDDGIEMTFGQKRTYLPLFVAVKDGMIVGVHKRTVALNDGQIQYDTLTEGQNSELEVIFTNLIEAIGES